MDLLCQHATGCNNFEYFISADLIAHLKEVQVMKWNFIYMYVCMYVSMYVCIVIIIKMYNNKKKSYSFWMSLI